MTRTKNKLVVAAVSLGICLAANNRAQQPASSATNSTSAMGVIAGIGFARSLPASRPVVRTGFWLAPLRGMLNGPAFKLTAASAPSLPVVGSGTLGRLTKWTGLTSGNSFIGDTSIFEDKYGNVGIGTDTPTSRLTVAGTIQSTSGGFKFPDGSVQTTAGVSASQVVRSLNLLSGDLMLNPGANITITPLGNTLTIAAPGSISAVAHDSTLAGDGTSASPLQLPVPLFFTGSVLGTAGAPGVLNVNNTGFD